MPKQSKPKIHTQKYINYEVHFGPKPMKEREVFTTTDETKAAEVFKAKQLLRLYVDVFQVEVQTITTTTRLTTSE